MMLPDCDGVLLWRSSLSICDVELVSWMMLLLIDQPPGLKSLRENRVDGLGATLLRGEQWGECTRVAIAFQALGYMSCHFIHYPGKVCASGWCSSECVNEYIRVRL